MEIDRLLNVDAKLVGAVHLLWGNTVVDHKPVLVDLLGEELIGIVKVISVQVDVNGKVGLVVSDELADKQLEKLVIRHGPAWVDSHIVALDYHDVLRLAIGSGHLGNVNDTLGHKLESSERLDVAVHVI